MGRCLSVVLPVFPDLRLLRLVQPLDRRVRTLRRRVRTVRRCGRRRRYNPRTGTYARGAAAYGPYGARGVAQAYNPRTGTYAATRQGSGVYGNWGSTYVQRGDDWAKTNRYTNRATGNTTRTVRTDEGGAISRRGGPGGGGFVAGGEGGNVYAGHDGNVYRRDGDTWQKSDNGGWSNTDRQPLTTDRRNRATARPVVSGRARWTAARAINSIATRRRGVKAHSAPATTGTTGAEAAPAAPAATAAAAPAAACVAADAADRAQRSCLIAYGNLEGLRPGGCAARRFA